VHADQLAVGPALAKVRRTPYACFYLEDEYVLDVPALLRGELPPSAGDARVLALAMLTGEQHRLRREELDLLIGIPASRWVQIDGRHDPAMLRALMDKGLLLSDTDDGPLAAVRERDEALAVNEWNLYAALYHFMTQWSGVELKEGEEEATELKARSRAAAQAHIARHGPPPGAFGKVDSTHEVALPGGEQDGGLYRALVARQTTRAFDLDTPMTLAQLDTVLRYVFGCHGYTRNVADVVCIKRTSPSGGGLHPIEAYPIINNVDGVDPGIYHYNALEHSLALLCELEPGEGQRMATSFMCGQSYFGAAHVSFVLTARFYRNHWKYRRHQKAYAGILMDAAHLSQTLYLVGAELDLGAFVTIAINARDIEKRFGLDGVSEGVIAMTGCGLRARGESPLEPRFSPEPDGS
jgi:putative peptide maturation dehydrogenase